MENKMNRKKNLDKMKNLELNQPMNQDLFSKLPMDVSLDILSRLPIKTISQCRWVSKTWYNFVRQPLFAKLHYSRVDSSSICAIFRDRYKQFYLVDHECFENLNTSATAYHLQFKEFEVNFTDGETPNCYEVVGGVNGMLCFNFHPSPYYICNPITGEYIKTLKSPKNHVDPLISGFGFDVVNDDYKVLRILQETSENGNKVEVYTLGSGTWREISTNLPPISGMTRCNVFVSGCLHWVAYTRPVIFCFNVATEEFSTMQQPHNFNNYRALSFHSLTVLRGCLCFIDCTFFMDYSADKEIWVMKDYGVHGSWTKEYVLQSGVITTLWQGSNEVIQLRNSRILLVCMRRSLGYYDPIERKVRSIEIHNLKNEPIVEIDLPIFQVGSLFSPKHLGIQAGLTEGCI